MADAFEAAVEVAAEMRKNRSQGSRNAIAQHAEQQRRQAEAQLQQERQQLAAAEDIAKQTTHQFSRGCSQAFWNRIKAAAKRDENRREIVYLRICPENGYCPPPSILGYKRALGQHLDNIIVSNPAFFENNIRTDLALSGQIEPVQITNKLCQFFERDPNSDILKKRVGK